MLLAAGLDLGGSTVKAWVADLETGACLASATVAVTTLRPGPHRAELDPVEWEAACRSALGSAVAQADRPGADYAGVTVCSLRQGFVLLDAAGAVLGNGVLNSDRRGGPYAEVLAGTHGVTGHWPAPELTLPKLLAVAAEEPDRWAATARVLFVHDWVLWLLTGRQVTETSYACAGGMADVARRGWAVDLLEVSGLGMSRLAPLVEAGAFVGELVDGWALPASLPVVAGSGDTQVAALGVGGLGDGVVTVVAGSSTPIQVATAAPVTDPLGRPWVSTHAAPGLWAAEGNAGYPGTMSGWWADLAPSTVALTPSPVVAVTAAPWWSRETWQHKPPASLVGLGPSTTAADVAGALVQAHAFAVAGGIADLDRAVGRPSSAVVVTGGAASDGVLPSLLAVVLGRDVHWDDTGAPSAVVGGCHLVARAIGAHTHVPSLPTRVVPAGDTADWTSARERWLEVEAALRAGLAD
ncbi:MAG: FGGY-family carbohydrate kinase [Mycobacteriales bacterium]|nr:FGGY-family carbohydrate kinase [Mycobacteriales bacterium]